jgi:hypothetical protein
MHIHLLATLFQEGDFFVGPLCFIILMMIMSVILRKYKNDTLKGLFLKAFYFKMAITLAYTSVISFYYGGEGDTEMYYYCTMDLHKAVMDNSDNFFQIYGTKVINVKTTLMNYFIYDGYAYPNFEFMHSSSNFMIPKLGLPIALIFDKSYLCMAMVFSFFALGGAIRLFKVFYHYFPQYYREIAFATLFLPSVAFWSSGFLKDPICYGAVGYLVYGIFNIFIKRRKMGISFLWIVISVILLYYIKVYILLALSPAIVLWLFSEFNKVVKNKTLRRIMAVMTFTVGAVTALLLINVTTSDENLKQYQLDTFVETGNYQRGLYEGFSQQYSGSYFSLGSKNPILLFPLGIVATLFRPFPWEVTSPIVMLSAAEAFMFLTFTIAFVYKRGFLTLFKDAFKRPVLIMCVIFALLFSAAIGSTAGNFGSLSRYKIPCLPFYLIMILVLYRESKLEYPRWFNRMLGYTKPFSRFNKPRTQ